MGYGKRMRMAVVGTIVFLALMVAAIIKVRNTIRDDLADLPDDDDDEVF